MESCLLGLRLDGCDSCCFFGRPGLRGAVLMSRSVSESCGEGGGGGWMMEVRMGLKWSERWRRC